MKMTVQDLDDTLNRFSRRSHRKSRAGCGNCKRRRVKCDEKKPICSNCSGRALDCTYSADYIRNSTSTTHLPETKSRFRSYSIAHNSLKESEESPKDKYQATSTNSVGVQCTLDIPSACTQHISPDDLLLFHHFIVSTYMTLGDPDFWQIHVPQWGMNFPSIQHLILALSALHLSHKCPSRRDEYVRKADAHFTFGLQSVRAVLAYLNSQTCQQVYISSALICFVYFARGPIAGEYLVFGDHGPSEWKGLLNGVKSIMESHRHEVFTGVLAPKPSPTTSSAKSASQRTGVDNHLEHVRKMRTLIQQNLQSNSDLAMYNSVIDDLLAITAEVYEKRSTQPQVELTQLLIGWVYRLPDEFVNQLEQKQSMSLVVLAYWAMLLKNMQSVWFMKGWDVHVMKGIYASLPSQFQQWIQWPVQQLEMDEIIL